MPKKASKVIARDAKQLAEEINTTKLGKFVDEKVTPLTQKHKKGYSIAGATLPFGVIAGSLLTQFGLADSLSEDIKKKAQKNFFKGKLIQQQARAHYDSIDAKEV